MNKTLLTLLLGIGIGVLIAPAKGSETWKKLVDGLDEYKDKVSDKASDLADQAKDNVNKVKSRFQSEVNEFGGSPVQTGN
jgi:gas vesicle protein